MEYFLNSMIKDRVRSNFTQDLIVSKRRLEIGKQRDHIFHFDAFIIFGDGAEFFFSYE